MINTVVFLASVVCLSCVVAMMLHTCLARRRLRTVSFTSGVIALVAALLPLAVSLAGARRESIVLLGASSRKADVPTALAAAFLTETAMVREGGTFGGILADMERVDMLEVFPGLKDYEPETKAVLWAYNLKPASLVKEVDRAGESRLIVKGKELDTGYLHAVIVPKTAVKSVRSIVCRRE